MDLGTEYLQSVIKRMKEYKSLAEKAMAQLPDEQLHFQPNAASNSIAVILHHLHGNMLSRWTNFLTEDGEKPWRTRDAEFEEQPMSREELMRRWEEGWAALLQTLQALTAAHLTQTITIRSQPLVIVDAINRQLAHYASHVGQIVFLAKWMRADQWQSLSIPKGGSEQYNRQMQQGQ